MKSQIKKLISDSIKAKECLYASEAGNIEKAAKAIIRSLKAGGKLLVFGNGGSAADSQHIAAELVGRFKMERRALPAIALTVNTSIITALANDYGYDIIFSRQVEALGSRKDIALGISTSGNAKNVIAGVKKARSLGMTTIALTGGNGGGLKKISDISIVAGSKDTPRIQESHILIAHIICELVEQGLFKKR
ncbi:MAG: D-sedoheptulose 7-phosphate isomerase [Candidatus Omnitrophota bacterium]|jgi:D-sedoheptulose 7-phosphate isomerase